MVMENDLDLSIKLYMSVFLGIIIHYLAILSTLRTQKKINGGSFHDQNLS
jgi:hypothetical protein